MGCNIDGAFHRALLVTLRNNDASQDVASKRSISLFQRRVPVSASRCMHAGRSQVHIAVYVEPIENNAPVGKKSANGDRNFAVPPQW